MTFLAVLFRFYANEALPNYIPNLNKANGDRDARIEDYFRLDFNYSGVL